MVVLLSVLIMAGLLTNVASAEDAPTMTLEYMEYIENQEYYDSLVMDYDYILYVSVGEAFQEQEKARLASGAEEQAKLIPSVTRGRDKPTEIYTILTITSKYSFSGVGFTYTNYKFNGQTAYKISVYGGMSGTQTVRVFYESHSTDRARYSFEVPGGTTVVSRAFTDTTDECIYLDFTSNYPFNGYIGGTSAQ